MTINVLMPVFATPVEWVQEAVKSIIAQSYDEHNFIIVDDNNPRGALTDYLYSLTEVCHCINIVRTKENKGIAAALNYGLQFCHGDLIVRMDADDIARPDLLKRHNEFFTAHPDRHICGVQIHLFNEITEWFSNHPSEITRARAFAMPGHWFVNHPGIAFRMNTINKIGGYGATPSNLAEDYALWVKFLCSGYSIYNQQEVLMDYRVHPKSFSFAPDRKSPEWHAFLKQQKDLLNEQRN
jgi:glycosyltransferase involved in cell wall biosynthesis